MRCDHYLGGVCPDTAVEPSVEAIPDPNDGRVSAAGAGRRSICNVLSQRCRIHKPREDLRWRSRSFDWLGRLRPRCKLEQKAERNWVSLNVGGALRCTPEQGTAGLAWPQLAETKGSRQTSDKKHCGACSRSVFRSADLPVSRRGESLTIGSYLYLVAYGGRQRSPRCMS